MGWETSLCTHVWIFSVGRGLAIFIRSPLNEGFIYDMGVSDDFDPWEFVRAKLLPKITKYDNHKIAQAVLSHPHSDHIARCEGLKNTYYPSLLTCPHDKAPSNGQVDERLNWKRIKNQKGSENLIETYRSLYEKRKLPLQSVNFSGARTVPNLEYGLYYVRPPVCERLHPGDDNKYGNTTSVLLYWRHGDNTLLIPADMTPEGMEHILEEHPGTEKRFTVFSGVLAAKRPNWPKVTSDQPSLKWLLGRGLSILVAPHHGLESCYSEELYSAMKNGKPDLVVISEKRHTSDTDGKVDPRYQSATGANGLKVEIDGNVEKRYSLSTVNGHHVLLVFAGSGVPKVYASKDPTTLLAAIG